MINQRILSVIKREIKVKLGKSFIFSTIFIPIIMGAIVGIQATLAHMKSESKAEVIVVVEDNNRLADLVKQSFLQADYVKSGLYKVDVQQMPASQFEPFLAKQRDSLIADGSKAIFVLPNAVLKDKKIRFYSANPANADIRNRVGAAVNKALNLNFFAANNIQNIDISFIQTDVGIAGNKVSSSGTQAESWGPLIVGGTMALLLLLGVTFNAMSVMGAVVSEKSNRIYEILLSSLNPSDILWGKLIGTTLVAMMQMLIWVAAGVALILIMDNFVDASSAFRMEFKPLVVLYYLATYITGLMIFLTLYAGMSSMFDNQSAASSALVPVYFAILLPFYTVFSLVSNPANAVAEVLSLVPLTSLYVMPARMMLIDVPIWQPAVALAGNMAMAYLANFIASKIYRISVLSTGNNPSLRQIFLWVKNAA